jgi:uncharacterized protein YjiS (DUF1127 family)
MSTYMNQHINLQTLVARADAQRAKLLGDLIGKGVHFVVAGIGSAFTRLQAANKQRAAVAQLMAMDERMLQDIGLNRSLVPFVVAGAVRNQAADLYADVGVGVNGNANDNGGQRYAA